MARSVSSIIGFAHASGGLLRTGLFALILLTSGRFEATSAPNPPIRFGLVAEDPALTEVSDVLTVELSKRPEAQLVERNELARIYREQQLSSSQANYVKLGEVLGADGLILLQLVKAPTNQFLSFQLIAVKPGVVLSSSRFPWPIKDRLGWATWTSRQLAPQFPKMRVLQKDAVPISVVNVRSALRSQQAQDEERQLTALTIERLLREPQLFVLERRRMELLQGEKELKGLKDSSFWNGSYLLDAVADRDGYSANILTLSVRLLPPDGRAAVNIELQGSRTNLQAIVEELAQRVKQNLKLADAAASWNPVEEAAKFLDEAKWALKWNMLSGAQSACECAWALGNQTKDAAELRIRVYAAQAKPVQNDSLAARPMHPEYVPDFSKLEPAIHALELYLEGFGGFLTNETKPDPNWYELALSLLIGDSDLLRKAHYHRSACQGQEEQLGELRRLARELVATIQHHEPYQNFRLHNHNVFFWGRKDSFFTTDPSLMEIEAVAGGFWHESPDESVEMYRHLERAGLLRTQRSLFAFPMLAAWKSGDDRRAKELWEAYLQELCSSTNALTRVAGYYLALADSNLGPDPKCQERKHQLFRAALEQAADLEAAGLAEGFVRDTEGLIGDIAVATPGSPIDSEYYAFRSQFNDARQRKGWQSVSRVNILLTERTNRVSRSSLTVQSPATQLSSSNRVARFWNLPHAMFDTEFDGPETQIIQCHYFEGKLWLEARKNSPPQKIFIFAVDLASFETDTIELPLDRITPKGGFEVAHDQLYIAGPEKLYRYFIGKGQWEELPLPVQGPFQLSVVGDRPFVSSASSILSLSGSGSETKLLASSRRRPAVTLLDSLDGLCGPIFSGPGDSVRTMINGKVYSYGGNSTDWTQVADFPRSANTPTFTSSSAGCIFREVTGKQQKRWWALAADKSSPELILAEPNEPASRVRWQVPPGLPLGTSRWYWEGEDLWIMSGELFLEADVTGGGMLTEHDGHHTLLAHFRKQQEPEVIPIWFELKDKRYLGRLSSKVLGEEYPTPQGYKHRTRIAGGFEGTPQGFIVTGDCAPGFWLIPRTDAPASPTLEVANKRPLSPDKALLAAAEMGDIANAKRALDSGASVSARDERGWTALILAAKAGNLPLAKMLVDHGADTTTRSTALFGSSVLCFAIAGNNPDLVKLLIDKGADPNGRSGKIQATPLYVAADFGSKEAAEALLTSGAKLNEAGAMDEWGHTYTPLMAAASKEHPKLVELFLAHGALLEYKNTSGATALLEAVKSRSIETLRVMLTKGADPNTKDADGTSALRHAVKRGRKETVKLLLDAGADPGDFSITAKPIEKIEDPEIRVLERDFPEIAVLLVEAQQRRAVKEMK